MLPAVSTGTAAVRSCSQDVNSILGQKEAELLTLRQTAIQKLEDQVNELQQHKEILHKRLVALQEDFDYNLELLDGRDAELSHFEQQTEFLQAGISNRERCIHDLSIRLQEAVALSEEERRQARALEERHANEVDLLREQLLQAQQEAAKQEQQAQNNMKAKVTALRERLAQQTLAEMQRKADMNSLRQALGIAEGKVEEQADELARLRTEGEQSTRQAETKITNLQQEVKLLQQKLGCLEQAHAADLSKAKQTMDALRRASQEERLEYERLLQAAVSHKSSDEALLEQRLASSSAQAEELQKRLQDSHVQAQTMQDILEDRIKTQAKAYQEAEAGLRSQLAATQRKLASESRRHAEDKRLLQTELRHVQNQLALLEKPRGTEATQNIASEDQFQQERLKKKDLQHALQQAQMASQQAAELYEAQKKELIQAKAVIRQLMKEQNSGTDLSHYASSAETTERQKRRGPSFEQDQLTAELMRVRTALGAAEQRLTFLEAENQRLLNLVEQQESSVGPQSDSQTANKLASMQAALASAEDYSQAIKSENERLMEISNELHAELRDVKCRQAAAEQRSEQLVSRQMPQQALQSSLSEQLGAWLAPGIRSQQQQQDSLQFVLQVPLEQLRTTLARRADPDEDRQEQQSIIPVSLAASFPPLLTRSGWDEARSLSGIHGRVSTDELAARLARVESLAEQISLQQAKEARSSVESPAEGPAGTAYAADAEDDNNPRPVNAHSGSSRATASQMSKYRGLQRRSTVPKVRNWNIKDTP